MNDNEHEREHEPVREWFSLLPAEQRRRMIEWATSEEHASRVAQYIASDGE